MQSLRDQVLDFFRENTPPTVRLNELSKMLHIPSNSDQYQELREMLDTLVHEGIVNRSSRRRYGLMEESSRTFEGVLVIHGFSGIVRTDSQEFPVISIKRHHLGTALNGDKVCVKLLAFRRDKKPDGEIISVEERNQKVIVGRLEFNGDFYFLIPDDNRLHVDFLVHPSRLHQAKDGDKVAIALYRWNDPHKSPEGEVIEILGPAGVPRVEYASIMKEFHLRKEFGSAVEQEAQQAAHSAMSEEAARRLDLRNEDIVTIDPVDARDFDDALSFRTLENGNYQVGVHIADVSHYVPENSELDQEALRRGTSVYLVDGVVPMLPEVLSNNICSLVPHEDRLAYTVLMEFSKRGVLKGYEIRESIINSRHRFSYDEVQKIISGAESDYRELLLNLHRFAEVLRKKRYSRGGIDFETTEVKFVLDENKNPVEVVLKKRSDATSLVEEYMLAANQTVATHVKTLTTGKRGTILPFIYRIHDEPDTDKLRNALELIRSFGIPIPDDNLTSKHINSLLEEIESRPEKFIIHQVLLRSMAKAVYSSHNIGHYGLGFSNYAHFTSPIRRYPDLIVHRLLKEYSQGIPSSRRLEYLDDRLFEISDHCSLQERLATEAERASIKLTQVSLVQEKIGEEFNGMVTGVTNFGIFVTIDDLYAEGLVRMRELEDDYYIFDEKKYALIGKRRRKVFRIGTRLRIKIVRVNIEKRELDFTYISDERTEEIAQEPTNPDVTAAHELVAQLEKKKRSKSKRATDHEKSSFLKKKKPKSSGGRKRKK